MNNRIIKFRAWSDKWDKMLYHGVDGYSIDVNNNTAWYDAMDDECITLMQFTGLFDKIGKWVYEGDVCDYMGSSMSRMIIKFENGCFVGEGLFNTLPLIDYIKAIDFESIEVIGNIYEHPELLK